MPGRKPHTYMHPRSRVLGSVLHTQFRERAVQSLNHHGLQRAAATVRRNLEHMLTTLDVAAKGGKVIDMQTVLQQYCVADAVEGKAALRADG